MIFGPRLCFRRVQDPSNSPYFAYKKGQMLSRNLLVIGKSTGIDYQEIELQVTSRSCSVKISY